MANDSPQGGQTAQTLAAVPSAASAPTEPGPAEAPDLETRLLCADGACIGTIGPEGRCTLCGTPVAPEDVAEFERIKGARLDDSFERPAPVAVTDDTTADGAWEDEDDGSPPELESRVLCADGACIGVIGTDGRCKVCGNSPEAVAEREQAEREQAEREQAERESNADGGDAQDDEKEANSRG